jgi:DNA-binding transcriptional LysR family regulator
MENRQLKYFVGVAEALSFSNAANCLFVSQSALSQQILLLENEIGTALFDRTKRTKERKVELTEAGTVFLIEAKKILQMSQKAIETARRIGLHKEVVKFGIFKTSLNARIELLGLFTKSFPEIELKIIELSFHTEVEHELMEENIDIGFTFLPIKRNDLSTKIYQKGYISIILPKNHTLANEPFLKLSDLQNEKWIEVGKPINPVLDQIEIACNKAGFNRESSIVQKVTSLELLNSLVSMGIGIAFAPSFAELNPSSNLVLKSIFNEDGTPFIDIEVSIGLAYKTENASPLILALMGLI